MDFSNIVKELESASLFDFYRLRAAINSEIENPGRIQKVKKHLRVGQMIDYFGQNENNI